MADHFINWFRTASPYIHAHRGKTFVVALSGSAVADKHFPALVHDIALLHGLGIRLVLVHGSRPQIEERLQLRNADMEYINGLRVTDSAALACVKEAAGSVRVEIEALLSTAASNSPMSGSHIRVASGNFVTAMPIGVRDGVDYLYTGEVRRVDVDAIVQQLDNCNMVLIPPLGYSPTGEVFNLSAVDVAGAVAAAIGADKLILLSDEKPLRDSQGKIVAHLTPAQADALIARRKKLPQESRLLLSTAACACRRGVKRSHLVSRSSDGILLRELFTRDGAGTLLSAEPYDRIRQAKIDDVAGILALIEPLEEDGSLVRRSRELLETEIDHFFVVERDGLIIACAALYPYPGEQMAEVACVVVHPEYRNAGYGDILLSHIEQQAKQGAIQQIFVLTTGSSHWFQERGFRRDDVKSLPMAKRGLYNYQRNSRVLLKSLE
ncbi:MAG: amino-acid N-acetyltransferase [Pseudomonadota bacterium]